MKIICYLNGEFLPLSDARISPMDRGFLFGDAVYEVVRVYGGHPFLLGRHLERLFLNLSILEIPSEDLNNIESIFYELLTRNAADEATLYLQISRGANAERRHSFVDSPVTVFGYATPFVDKIAPQRHTGCDVITLEDKRSQWVSIKTVNLLPNVLANQRARIQGVTEALLVSPTGDVLEGTHTNLFGVANGVLRTAPLSLPILPGITREVVLSMAKSMGIPTEERALKRAELFQCEEAFLTGTTTEILPVVRADGKTVGKGIPGGIAKAMQHAFRERIASDSLESRAKPFSPKEWVAPLPPQTHHGINQV